MRTDGKVWIIKQFKYLFDLLVSDKTGIDRLLPNLLEVRLLQARARRSSFADDHIAFHTDMDKPMCS